MAAKLVACADGPNTKLLMISATGVQAGYMESHRQSWP